jgi:CopA family copper-resistance protein
MLSRRAFLRGTALAGAVYGVGSVFGSFAKSPAVANKGIELGDYIEKEDKIIYDLVVRKSPIEFDGRLATGIAIDGNLPAPLIRLREGMRAELNIYNELNEITSIHWHGILLPYQMDGVPGVTFPGIKPKEKFTASFRVKQYGTYWYHSHAGLQEQLGHYGPLILDPAEPEPFKYDREYVIVLSDWSFEDPHWIMSRLKKAEGYFNYNKRTVFDLLEDIKSKGFSQAMRERLMWAAMRMSSRDIADVTGATYTFLVNGHTPKENWTALFKPGERVRLRFINASAMTYFDVRIPGLSMTVVQADGQNVQPVEVDEFRIAVAERYDVIVHPREDRAYTIFAEAMDRSGYARATLAPRHGMSAPIPPLREPPERGMEAHGGAHAGHGSGASQEGMHKSHGGMHHGMKMHHGMHNHKGMKHGMSSNPCGVCEPKLKNFKFGPAAAMINTDPLCRLNDPGVGLKNVKHRVLKYTDLKSYVPWKELYKREPDRVVEIHFTGNMERFLWRMWTYDGKRWSSNPTDFIRWRYGELVRMIWVNHTMMDHPIHLHGMWMYLDNGSGEYKPRKDTINLKPGEKICIDVLVDAYGYWAFHCHLLYHMHAGMIRVVEVK